MIKVILQEQCQRMRFFSFDSVWRGLWAARKERVLLHSPPHARIDS